MEQVKQVTYKILKRGRKWYTGQSLDTGYENQIAMGEMEFEVGGTYTFNARIVKETSSHGTKVQVYPLTNEQKEDAEREQRKQMLLKECKKCLGYCKDNYTYYESGFDTLHRDMEELKNLGVDVAGMEKEVQELAAEKKVNKYRATFKKYLEYIKTSNGVYHNGIDICKDAMASLKELGFDTSKLKEKLALAVDEKVTEENRKAALKLVNAVKEEIKANEIPDMNSLNQVPDEYRNELLELYNERFGYLKNDEVLKNNRDRFIKQCFTTVDADRLVQMLVNENKLRLHRSWERFSEEELKKLSVELGKLLVNASVDGKMYILNARIPKETYKQFMKDNRLRRLSSVLLKNVEEFENNNLIIAYDMPDCICTAPEEMVEQLYHNGFLKDVEHVENEEDRDAARIRMYMSEPLEGTWDYRKECVDGQEYYLVRVLKSMQTRHEDRTYYAYYLLGMDSDTKQGFCHRIEWHEEGHYEHMSVAGILKDVFYANEGYERLQGDIVCKEVDYRVMLEQHKSIVTDEGINIMSNGAVIATKEASTKVVEKFYEDGNLASEDSRGWKNDYRKSEVAFRKNFILKAREGGSLYTEGEYKTKRTCPDEFRSYCKSIESVYVQGDCYFQKTAGIIELKNEDKDKLIEVRLKDFIDEEELNEWTKLQFNYYFRYVECEEKPFKNVEIHADKARRIHLFNNEKAVPKYNDMFFREADEVTSEVANIGNHIIDGEIILWDNRVSGARLVKGGFELDHHQHKHVKHGEEGKYYILRPAKRHKTRKDLRD